jgi:hypothetical protein
MVVDANSAISHASKDSARNESLRSGRDTRLGKDVRRVLQDYISFDVALNTKFLNLHLNSNLGAEVRQSMSTPNQSSLYDWHMGC